MLYASTIALIMAIYREDSYPEPMIMEMRPQDMEGVYHVIGKVRRSVETVALQESFFKSCVEKVEACFRIPER